MPHPFVNGKVVRRRATEVQSRVTSCCLFFFVASAIVLARASKLYIELLICSVAHFCNAVGVVTVGADVDVGIIR